MDLYIRVSPKTCIYAAATEQLEQVPADHVVNLWHNIMTARGQWDKGTSECVPESILNM